MTNPELAELLFPGLTLTPEDLEKRYPERDLPEGAVVSRHAPSPTGFVHIGNVVQSLTSERICRQSGGVLYLRIEDTDRKREVAGAVGSLIDSLSHYGIRFDEGATADGDLGNYGPYRQRERARIYHVYAKKLVSEGKAYPCFCSEDELRAMRETQSKLKESPGYYGKWAVWRDRPAEEAAEKIKEGEPWVLRFRSEGGTGRKFKFKDLIKGEMDVTENNLDIVLLKSDGIPTYHFAHAVDDHLMRTTHVIRGDEWISSLPVHIQLFEALGFKLPKYGHIGQLMIVDGGSKRKISKRKDPEFGLVYYKQNGIPVDSVKEYILTILNSNFEDWRRANPDSDIDDFKFSLSKMNPAGSLFDAAKLNDVSKNVISRYSADKVYDLLFEWASEYDPDYAKVLDKDPSYAKKILSIGRDGKKRRKDYGTWKELREYTRLFYDEYFEVTDEYPDEFDKADIKRCLSAYRDGYDPGDDRDKWFDGIKAIAGKLGYAEDMRKYKADPGAYKGSVADISMFIRVAVTGKLSSPDMYDVTRILGYERVMRRIDDMLKKL